MLNNAIILKTKVTLLEGYETDFTASLFLPDTPAKTLFFCQPGGGNTKDYFNLGQAEGFDYSFASRMCAHGHAVMLMDHAGIGENAIDDTHPFFTPRQSVSFTVQALKEFFAHPAIADVKKIGTGHSMGGMMVTLINALLPFDAICLIGSNAGGLDWGLQEDDMHYLEQPEKLEKEMEQRVMNMFKAPFINYESGGPSLDSVTFGAENEGAHALLMKVQSSLFSAGGYMSMIRGSFRPEVNKITAPMFIAAGEHDLGLPLAEAPKDYINAASVKSMELPGAGHNSFAFSAIESLCDAIDDWTGAVL
ncbi:hypothetical protein IMCC14465_18600 [alpha proteobacterium IMCC14465]|uniref:AB hydrolase-1 domain-containing protein n=1 Tax=alpha proteobacterium IMCC14465 TaxID=1220535 RepID=J9DXG8_9PROT|nr:hypothetical protein IMCC14465_18600 [alpha proteobacterium IMCC14465]